uniref:Uncharacterized protein n=1 Tax=Octopus bimaculoides TaxID=37653 RepID=A0A0L8GDZ7_OCTBM
MLMSLIQEVFIFLQFHIFYYFSFFISDRLPKHLRVEVPLVMDFKETLLLFEEYNSLWL